MSAHVVISISLQAAEVLQLVNAEWNQSAFKDNAIVHLNLGSKRGVLETAMAYFVCQLSIDLIKSGNLAMAEQLCSVPRWRIELFERLGVGQMLVEVQRALDQAKEAKAKSAVESAT